MGISGGPSMFWKTVKLTLDQILLVVTQLKLQDSLQHASTSAGPHQDGHGSNKSDNDGVGNSLRPQFTVAIDANAYKKDRSLSHRSGNFTQFVLPKRPTMYETYNGMPGNSVIVRLV